MLSLIVIFSLFAFALVILGIVGANRATATMNEMKAREDEERQARIDLLRAQTEALKTDR